MQAPSTPRDGAGSSATAERVGLARHGVHEQTQILSAITAVAGSVHWDEAVSWCVIGKSNLLARSAVSVCANALAS
jgi:hypothetical protein